ncbi:MAG: hypothetical protein AAF125_11205 [Chloroflexota bacterium]
MRNTSKLLTLIPLILLAIYNPLVVQADTPLPQSGWYAVIWNRTDDTLHWVNNATELASIPRPQLPGEVGSDLYISPNGRWMMLTALLQDQSQAVGLYDLQTGEWLQVHMAQPGESIIAAERNPFSRNSAYAAIGLHSDTGWRVINFETATGNAIGQFSNTHLGIAPDFIPLQAVPRVMLYSLDEGTVQWQVHVRFVTQGPNASTTAQPSLVWSPQQDVVSAGSFEPMLLDADILPIQNQVLYSVRDENVPTQTRIFGQTLGFNGELVYEQGGAFIVQPRWVAGGQFVAYRVTQGAQVPMWYMGGYGANNLTPFAPDYDELLGTVDGFVLVDYEGGEVKFSNTLAFDAFTPTIGNVIYTTDTSNFRVAYITPMGTQFTLPSIATPGGTPAIDVADNIAAPSPSCGTAPAPRLTVGNEARVTFTDGTPLNIRTTASGDYLMQITEGTVVNVVDGPVCSGNFNWWSLQFESQGATVGGWAAEGDSEDYYLEPYNNQAPLGVAVQPTPTEVLQVVPQIQPTVAPPLQVAPPAQPTAAPGFDALGNGDCSNAPDGAELAIGEFANTRTDGTLAMRTALNDEFPSNNIPDNQTVTVLNGPVCNNGFRMWYVSTTLNGMTVQGWMADGFSSNRYLRPGPARAQ